ncbi:LysR family transcriptional regulator [Paracoccus sp. pheM1]|uniref:LysR family transcriptional regulator n=1 Tax=Paracoccus sp. pheM1 TaxID=2831675 RepID=UPI001BDB8E69|nr:LysR family transcriptional regulator [Paracoccus sp. pheM1]MBT0778734.1 LysR family transcriptional regulator [Paracoccus sp. pheM1]
MLRLSSDRGLGRSDRPAFCIFTAHWEIALLRFTLRQLSYFRATAALGSIASAAKELGVSTAAISAAIDNLEAIAGTRLFNRFPAHGVKLTPSGEILEQMARGVLAEAEKWAQGARNLRTDAGGKVRIGAYLALVYVFAIPILMRNREIWPKVELDFVESSHPNLLEQLNKGHIDIMMLYDLCFEREGYDVVDLAKVEAKVVLPASSPLAGRKRLALGDLEGLSYVRLDREIPGRTMLDLLYARGIKPPIAFSSSSYELVRSAVGKGLGFTFSMFQPHNAITYQGDRLVCIPLEEPLQQVRIIAACRKGRLQEDVIRNVISTSRHVLEAADSRN